ncbi:MAG: cytochrome c biogenesis protein CcsA [Marinilabiliaceae bacterium]|nr:cytochrome c biogenesis protein CcsA [Marinilabiliaceae bacterium]
MNKILDFLTAKWLMGTLLLFLAAVMGVATFIERDFGTNASKALVYNAWWFELVFVILAINLLGNLFKYKIFSWKKLPVLVFHLAFLLIIIGAGITRYLGYEGLMHIREGAASNTILSGNQYVKVNIIEAGNEISDQSSVLFSTVSPFEYSESFTTSKGKLRIRSEAFIPQAMSRAIEKPGGRPALQLVLSSQKGRQEVSLFPGDNINIGSFRVAFEPAVENGQDIVFTLKDGVPYYKGKQPSKMMAMQSGQEQFFAADSLNKLFSGVLYNVGALKMVLTQQLESAVVEPVSVPGDQGRALPNAVKMVAELGDVQETFYVFGRKDMLGEAYSFNLNGIEISATYGSKVIELPFSLHLNKFELERYPGSNSPSSYASEVTLIDGQAGVKENRRIFMNNILNYRGFRFFQSSYDTDEKGTVLSVNQDMMGTIITYIGYLLLTLGMFAALFAPNTRFRFLIKRTDAIYKEKKKVMTILLVLISLPAFSADLNPPHTITAEMGNAFGRVWVQDNGGRMEPLNTLNGEIMRKIVKHHTFRGWSADRVVLSMMIDRQYWQEVPMITVKHDELRAILNVTGRKAAFQQFFTPNGEYKIRQIVETAYRKPGGQQSKLDQEAIKIDEQVNVFYMTQMGSLLKIFPQPADSHLPWLAPGARPADFPQEDSLFVRNIFGMYVDALVQNKNGEADEYLTAIVNYQNKYGADILPGDTMKEVEIFYNESSLFMTLSPYFLLLGILLLVFQLIRLVKPKYQFKWVMRIGFTLIIIAFALYTAGMGIRWYISGHAPWSNGYESMLYIGWSVLVAGLLFSMISDIALSVTSIFAGVILMVAHLSWMNPEITNLVPVLKSYWLTIHVAVIVKSYGFLGLSAFLSFLNLVLIGIKTPKNKLNISSTVELLSSISEMSITVGLYLLTIGAFLGGVWANESWGRYWGWDPKETWSAVTIVVYAFVLHMRFIPGMKSLTTFNIWSVISFASVIMTYLGVNYLLAGMHSYAKGEAANIPAWVYYTTAVITVVVFYAIFNEGKLRKVVEMKE